MAEAFQSGDLLLVILGVVVLEAFVLIVFAGRSAGRFDALDVIFNLASGALLLLATRSALIGDPWFVTAAWVTASLPTHLIDIWRRWAGSESASH